jgi:hypothetical protein
MNRLFLALSLAFLASSCVAHRGVIPIANGSVTQLDQGNFTVIQTGVRGEASCPYFLTFIPLKDPSIATLAMNELVASSGVHGKKRGLVNFALDVTEANYFYIVLVRTATTRADVVEFE